MSTNPVNNLSAAQLRRAADIREQIEGLEAKLHAVLSGGAAPAPTPTASAPAKKKDGRKGKKGKRSLSPEALERIRAGQAKRWAKVRAAEGAKPAAKATGKKRGRKPKAAAAEGKAPKRKMSAEGRARIQAAVKARWARVAAEKAAAGGAAPKKKAGKRGRKKAS